MNKKKEAPESESRISRTSNDPEEDLRPDSSKESETPKNDAEDSTKKELQRKETKAEIKKKKKEQKEKELLDLVLRDKAKIIESNIKEKFKEKYSNIKKSP